MDLEVAIETLLAGDDAAVERVARELVAFGPAAAPACFALVGRLASPDPFTRAVVRDALLATGPGAAAVLVGGLTAPQALVRSEVLNVLEGASADTSQAVRELLPAPGSVRERRAMTDARKLLLGADAPCEGGAEATPDLSALDVPVLAEAARSEDRVRGAAALSELADRLRAGRETEACLGALVELIAPDRKPFRLSVDVLTLLGLHGAGCAEVVDALRSALVRLSGGALDVRRMLVSEPLALVDPDPPGEIAEYLSLPLREDYMGEEAARAAHALIRLGPRAALAAPLLVRTLETRFDGDVGAWRARRWAAIALGRLDDVQREVVEALRAAARDPDILLALEAARALHRLHVPGNAVPDVLRRARAVPSDAVRALADEIEAEIGRDG